MNVKHFDSMTNVCVFGLASYIFNQL